MRYTTSAGRLANLPRHDLYIFLCPQEGDPAGWWDETFNGHLDSKPKGPESMSLDLSFPGCDHVYGLPERATSLALKATTGERQR